MCEKCVGAYFLNFFHFYFINLFILLIEFIFVFFGPLYLKVPTVKEVKDHKDYFMYTQINLIITNDTVYNV